MCDAFRERRDVMVAGLNAIPGIRCRKPGGAFYLFPNISGICARSLARSKRTRELRPADRARSSPATLVQMFLLWRYQVATMDRRSFGSIGAEVSIISASPSRPRSTISSSALDRISARRD